MSHATDALKRILSLNGSTGGSRALVQELKFIAATAIDLEEQPKHVGTWVVLCENNEMFKFGKDDDTKFPYPPDEVEAVQQAKYLFDKHSTDANIYLLQIFDNGQMKTLHFFQ